jgi:hypothetical protein
MFVVKSMDVNSNLLRLKLDLVYRNLSMDEGQTKFAEITQTTIPEPSKETETGAPVAPPPPAVPSKPKRKSVKTIVAK